MTSKKFIVFITRAFFSNYFWNEWMLYPNNYSTNKLRNELPRANIAFLRLTTVIKLYGDLIRRLPLKPILIGHSLSALIVQVLIQQVPGTTGVAIHSFPAFGVLSVAISFSKKWWRYLEEADFVMFWLQKMKK